MGVSKGSWAIPGIPQEVLMYLNNPRSPSPTRHLSTPPSLSTPLEALKAPRGIQRYFKGFSVQPDKYPIEASRVTTCFTHSHRALDHLLEQTVAQSESMLTPGTSQIKTRW